MTNLFYKVKIRGLTNLKNLGLYLRFISSKPSQTNDTNRKKIYVDLSDPRLERYYYLLLKFFDLADCQINIKMNPWLLLNLRNYNNLIYNLESLKIVLFPPKNFDLWLTANKKLFSQKNVLLVDINYFTQKKAADEYVFPYNMHPDVYDSDLYKSIPTLREVKKSIKVFFGGNTGVGYGNLDIPKFFGKITRNEIVAYLEEFSDKDKLINITTEEEANLLLSGKYFEIVSAKKPLFTLENWLEVLARSNFYIALPGFSMPFSHNVVEAMSVGTIPILQYPEMFTPPLTNLVDCLSFDSKSDLIDKINLALNLNTEKILAMRENVLKYYDENLEPETAVDKLFDKLPTVRKLYLNAEHNSVAKLKEEISQIDSFGG